MSKKYYEPALESGDDWEAWLCGAMAMVERGETKEIKEEIKLKDEESEDEE